ncbi:MAG: type II secretion system protein GspN [Myxococcota bacterium]|nr:type II secretion system protein GspN [Myxococcota bacterium]
MLTFLDRKLFRYLGYGVFFVVLFFVFLLLGFPIERFKGAAEQQLATLLKRDIRIGDMDMTMSGNIVLTNVEIAKKDDDNPASPPPPVEDGSADASQSEPRISTRAIPYRIEEIQVNVGFLDLLFDRLDVKVDIQAFGGGITAAYSGPMPQQETREKQRIRPRRTEDPSAEETQDSDIPLSLEMRAEGLVMKRMPGLSEKIPVPVDGSMDLAVELTSQAGLFSQSDGRIALTLKDVGLSKPGYEAEMFDMKLAVPPLKISSLKAEMNIEDGTGEINNFAVTSKHFDAKVEGTIAFRDPLSRTQLDLYLTFKIMDAYINQSDALKTLFSSLDLFSRDFKRAHRDDGYYGFRYRGRIGEGRFLPQKKYTPPRNSKTRRPDTETGRRPARPERRIRPSRQKPSAEKSERPPARHLDEPMAPPKMPTTVRPPTIPPKVPDMEMDNLERRRKLQHLSHKKPNPMDHSADETIEMGEREEGEAEQDEADEAPEGDEAEGEEGEAEEAPEGDEAEGEEGEAEEANGEEDEAGEADEDPSEEEAPENEDNEDDNP